MEMLSMEELDKRHQTYDEDIEWGCASWCEYIVVTSFGCVLLLGALGLAIFWAYQYHDGFGWTEEPEKQFNLHPVLMIAGFITFSGFSMLLYRICRCCRRISVKLLHTLLHALAIPCIGGGFLAIYESHKNHEEHFYSLHSWIGLVTMGLFATQFVMGFFSFLVLLTCGNATATFRAFLLPIHTSFGLTTFMLAIAAAVTGLTQHVLLGGAPQKWTPEFIVINALGITLIALGILVSFAVRSSPKFDSRRSLGGKICGTD